MIDKDRAQRSVDWMRQNYQHIWCAENLDMYEKAGFLAATCNPHRCYLATLSLRERIDVILGYLT